MRLDVALASIAVSALAMLARPALAQYPDRTGWEPTVRVFGFSADASGEDTDPGSFASTFELGGGTGLGVSYEFRPKRRFGIEVGIEAIDLDMEAILDSTAVGGDVQSAGGSLTFIPLTAALNLHLLGAGKADLYVGAVAGFATAGSESFPFTNPLTGVGFTLDVAGGDDAIFGGQVGLDVTFGDSGWGLGLRVRSLGDFTIEEESITGISDVEISESVLLAGIGLVRRF